MTYPLIGLIGKRQSGKDTFAGYLAEDFGYARHAFADPLREVALATDPLIETHPFGVTRRLSDVIYAEGWDAAKERHPEVRRLLQDLGVGVRESVGEATWVEALKRRARAEDGPVVVTDVRFPNEADAIERLGGTLVRIERDGRTRSTRDGHVSETALDDYPARFTVRNNSSLQHLRDSASAIHRRIY